jgi:hypothetical protein
VTRELSRPSAAAMVVGVAVGLGVAVVACQSPAPSASNGAPTTVPDEKKTLYCTTSESPDFEYAPNDGFRVSTPLGAPVGGCFAKLAAAGVFHEVHTKRRCGARVGPLAECVTLVDVHVFEPTFPGAKVRARVREEDGVLRSGGPAIPCYEVESAGDGRVKYRATDLGKRVTAACDRVWVVDAKGAPALALPSEELVLANAPAATVSLYDLEAPRAPDAGSPDAQGEFASGSLRPFFKTMRASSFYEHGSERHPPEQAFDGDPATAWAEGVPGPGKGEWIEVEFDRPVEIEAIEMATGFDHVTDPGEDLFPENARFKKVRVETSEGDPYEQDVPDGQRSLRIELGGRKTTRLRIVAADVVPGKKWQDLSLSEATVLGKVAK